MRRTTALGSAIAIALAVRLAHGPGALGYDALWGLRWGDQILHLHAPTFVADTAPTPHPLVNLASALLMILGTDAATTILLAVSWLSLGALAVVLARLGATLFSWPVGVLAAVAILTRSLLSTETAQALTDLPFLALVVAALDRELRRPREGWTVPVLLVLAGLLRPEAWALELVYLVYRRDVRVAALLALAPLLWAGLDLWATGDALHSLHGTRDLGVALDRPRSTGTALTLAPAALRDIIQQPLLWVALAGALAGLLGRDRDSAVPGGITVLGLAGYLVLGIAGLPLLGRYLLLPATMLLLFAGLAVFGWVDARRHHRAWQLLGAAAAVTVLAGTPADVRKLRDARTFDRGYHAIQEDLRDATRAANRFGCARAVAPDHRSLAVVAAQRLGTRQTAGTASFAAVDPARVAGFAIGAEGPQRFSPGARRVYRGDYWEAAIAACA
ncbi:MAG: hypothetical protein QOI80_525 [Solirubrobacteraceae bacterium]|nr:hypothetical protein [Solirubrobacteraceae bacterium]